MLLFPTRNGTAQRQLKTGQAFECLLNIFIQLRRFQEDLFAQCHSSKFTGHLASMSARIVAGASTLFSKNILNSAVSFW